MVQNINESFLKILITENDKYVDLQNLLLKRVVKQSNTWTDFKYQILVNKPINEFKIDFTLGSINNNANTELMIERVKINKIRL
jgi:hypothetical protein